MMWRETWNWVWYRICHIKTNCTLVCVLWFRMTNTAELTVFGKFKKTVFICHFTQVIKELNVGHNLAWFVWISHETKYSHTHTQKLNESEIAWNKTLIRYRRLDDAITSSPTKAFMNSFYFIHVRTSHCSSFSILIPFCDEQTRL